MFSSIIISLLIFVHIFFFIALIRKNFAVIDIGWSLGIILISIISYLHQPISMKNAWLLLIVFIWGLRLSLYIYSRSVGKPEDPRYAKFRELWKPHSNLQAYFKVFLFQGFLMLMVSLPVSVNMTKGRQELSLINWIGVFVWLIGFIIEVSADTYMNWWRKNKDNHGKICTTGPWRFSRYPNYFGEVLLWYGIYLVSVELSTIWTIIGPITINFLILKVTGIPLLEERHKDRPGFEEYAKRVPRFIPFTKPKL
jgi:steroid 5-alpha reductase family enzyme